MSMDLAQLEKSTPMEVLEHVRGHLLEQGAKSIGRMGGCLYRGNHGRSCGAGCLLSNEDYNRLNAQEIELGVREQRDPENKGNGTIEGMGWNILCSNDMVTKVHMPLITRLQTVHDSVEVCQWPLALSVVEADILNHVYDCDVEGD